MTLTSSRLDSTVVSAGELSGYTINSSAIPVDVGDSNGSITTFSTVQSIDHDNHEYAIAQTLTLGTSDAGTFVGKVVQVSKVQNSNIMNLQAETFMNRLTSTQRCYPLYRMSGLGTWEVASAMDHWTQQAGVFYDRVPGDVFAYSSMFGHDYMYTKNLPLPPHEVMTLNGAPVLPVYAVSGSRVYRSLLPGALSTLSMSRSTGVQSTIELSVPKSTSNERIVLTSGLMADGTRTGNFKWTFNKGGNTSTLGSIQLAYDLTTGFTLSKTELTSSTYTTVIAATGALVAGNRYRFYIGLKENTATSTMFTLRVVNTTAGTVVVDTSASATTSIRGLVNWKSSSLYSPNTGTGNIQVHGFGGTIIKGELPTAALADQKSLATTTRTNAAIPGCDGDVWTNLKTLLSLHKMDLWYEDDKLKMSKRDTVYRTPQAMASSTVGAQQREKARRVEVTVQNSVASPFTLGSVFFKADSVYQVATAEVQEVIVQTDHSIDTLNNPTAVTGISPYPYVSGVGQYVVTGSDGYIVSPTWWNVNGGKVTAEPTEKEGEIKIVIKGPDFDSVRAPYRISEGDAGRPALYVTGQGILNTPSVLQVATGNPTAAEDIGETVDNPFITDVRLAYDAAAQVSLRYASPELTLQITETKDGIGTPAFGFKPSGALFRQMGNAFRTISATQTHSSIQLTAIQYNTIGTVNNYYAGGIIDVTNKYKGNKTIKDATLKRIGYFDGVAIESNPLYPSATTFPNATTFPGGE